MPFSNQYLLIQNQGEAPIEGYTVLGYSSTRNCGVDGAIGQFGSGAKHAVNLCLRNGLSVWVYCGKTRLEFALEEETVNDGLRDDTIYHVTYRKNSNETSRRAGWVLDFGVLDWDDIGMGLREFVSNAIDRTLREEGNISEAKNANRLSVKIVDDSDRRAKGGFTRVYVALNDDVREYYGNLGKKFLHFSDSPELSKPGLIEKFESSPAQIYREGVWVRELDGASVFDYNFTRDEIKIDECRNSSDYSVKAACARKLQNAGSSELTQVMRAQIEGRNVVESSFDEDYLTGFNKLTETQSERWAQAWDVAAGPGAVICDNQFSKDYADKKGHNSHIVGTNWMNAIRCAGVTSAMDILSIDEQRGRMKVDATEDARLATRWAWELFQCADLTGDRDEPEVFCFKDVMKAESQTFGFQNSEGVHYHISIADDGQSTLLKKAALEEVAHWITGATDNSRDFQDFFINILVALA